MFHIHSLWQIDETIVALIDPDFIFLKPLTTRMNPEEIVARGDGLSLEGLNLENGGWVRKGYPAGEVPHDLVYRNVHHPRWSIFKCFVVVVLREEQRRRDTPEEWTAVTQDKSVVRKVWKVASVSTGSSVGGAPARNISGESSQLGCLGA